MYCEEGDKGRVGEDIRGDIKEDERGVALGSKSRGLLTFAFADGDATKREEGGATATFPERGDPDVGDDNAGEFTRRDKNLLSLSSTDLETGECIAAAVLVATTN